MTALVSENLESYTGVRLAPLAWAGWQLHIPSDWRPLKIYGTPEKGWMMVGDAYCACFSIHWQQSNGSVSDGKQWATDRLKRLGLFPDSSPPSAERFSACAWARDVQSEEEKKTTHWFGYSESADLLLGLKVNGALPEEHRDSMKHDVLPSLQTSPADDETIWTLYGLSLVSPPNFKLVERHLYMGDVALRFQKNRQESLMLRQVYPGGLALGRRNFERWLASYPFTEHRRMRASSVTMSSWQHPDFEDLVGLRRRGCKRLGIPLGGIMPRWNHALAVHDQTLDRLLIAEHSDSVMPDERICENAIAQMNRPLRESL